MKKLFKKFFLVAFAGLLVAGAAACDKPTEQPTEEQPTEEVKPSKTPVAEFKEENFAHGPISYVAASYEKRTQILGLLEKYAVKNNLTGLTLYEDGGYVMYHPSVVKGTNNYIPGYGFGILSEGYLNADLEGETNAAWKRYLHTFQTEDPATINYMNDKGSVVSDLISYVTSSYWGTEMNETKDGYVWTNVQSNSPRPIAVDGKDYEGQILATKYKFEVKVGADYKYNTLSTNPTTAKYNGTSVKLEDYVTPYKIYYTSAYAMARGSENLDGAGSIKGSAEYYAASKEGFSQEAWDKIGIKAYTDKDGKSWLEFEFNTPCNQFYAMYYLSSGMFSPVPAEFITDLGNGDFAAGTKAWGNKTNSGLTVVDTFLSTGAYTIERWDTDQQIVFKKNPYYTLEGESRYQIAGVHMNILSAAATDPLAALKEFEANKLHSCGIPLQVLDQYKDDDRTTTTVGSSTFKLNFNSCTQEEWVKLFGENGTITQTAPEQYWECEPIMSNDDFLKGLSYSINRADFASKIGRTPSNDYFGSGYLSDPENGIMYNQTPAHKDAMAELSEGTEYGYNLEFAKKSFKKAADALIASGAYEKGETVKVEIAWMHPTDEDEYHAIIKKYIEDAWNASGAELKLEVVFWVGQAWSDVYYNKMMLGQFDIGFGAINGNTLNPLNFLEVLRSDNSSGFTLNWGCDTSVVSEELYLDGMYWSFDALWEAADKGGYFEKGKIVSAVQTPKALAEGEYVENDADGTATITFDCKVAEDPNMPVKVDKVVLFSYVLADNADGYAYSEESVAFEIKDGKMIVTLTAEQLAVYRDTCIANEDGYVGIDVYYTFSIEGMESSTLNTVNFLWPSAE